MRARETEDPGESGPGPGAGGLPPGSEPPGEPGDLSLEEPCRASPGEDAPSPCAPFFVTLRFARIRLRGTFTTAEATLRPGDWVLARTVRGTEHAQVLSRPRTVAAPPGLSEPEEAEVVGEVVGRLAAAEVQTPWGVTGRFTREFRAAADMIAHMGLPMHLTDVEILPRRDKAVFYFLADGRVDFRQLVRNLARTLRLRVEMKQIGVRDEARLKGTCGHCGLDLCCARWIRRMAPVNMKMAKTQKTTLDPDKISGRCGRLLCCLRYEEHVYIDHRNRMPGRNQLVRTPSGTGRVASHDLLPCLVRVALEGGEIKPFPLEQIELLSETGPAPAGDAGNEAPPCQSDHEALADERPESEEWSTGPFATSIESPDEPDRALDAAPTEAAPEEEPDPEQAGSVRRKKRRRRRKGPRPASEA